MNLSGSTGPSSFVNTTLAGGDVQKNGIGAGHKPWKTGTDANQSAGAEAASTSGMAGASQGTGGAGVSGGPFGSHGVVAGGFPHKSNISMAYMSSTPGISNLPPGGTRGLVEYLIQLVLNTLDAQVHVCRDHTDEDSFDIPTPPMRLRGQLLVAHMYHV